MSAPGDLARDAAQTALRLLPWPTEPGLRAIGRPGAESPVIVTGNYDLTVRRVMRALSGLDAWVVVANSSGVNVWCASAGGLLTTHQVVTALRTSGVEDRVRHRRALLPQLAATGVRVRELTRRCGWTAKFGPVRIEDLPAYLAAREHKNDVMRRVRFGARERLEMALAWGCPAAALLVLGSLLWRPAWSLPLAGLAFATALLVFLGYDRLPGPHRLLLTAALAATATALTAFVGGGAAALVTAALASAGLVAVITFDYEGSTPTEGGSHFESKRWHITLDLERCAGVFSCYEVCPEACFEKRTDPRKTELVHDERCVRCGACVVQCPQDALFFRDEQGERIEPAVIRRYKLNLLGRRRVDVGAEPPLS